MASPNFYPTYYIKFSCRVQMMGNEVCYGARHLFYNSQVLKHIVDVL